MRQQQIITPEAGFVEYPNALAFMYSRQPVVVQCGATGSYLVTVTVTCDTNGGVSYSEQRRLHKGRGEFDISRIMQILAPGPDQLLQRLHYATDAPLSEVFSLKVEIGNTVALDLERGIQAMYGALDAGEAYGGQITLKLYRNYPQTLTVWRSMYGQYNYHIGPQSFAPTYSEGPSYCRAVTLDAVPWIDIEDVTPPVFPITPPEGGYEAQTAEASAASVSPVVTLRDGVPVFGSATIFVGLQDGLQLDQSSRTIVFVPDMTPRGCGVFLRWLNRRGEVSYWLFDKRQLETAAAVSESFTRHYEGDLVAPASGVYLNEDKRSYAEARAQGISTKDLSAEQFDELCSLFTSPVVEMLYEPEEHTGYTKTGDFWMRVNVEAGALSRRNWRNTPKLHSLEATVILPRRNTAQL